MDENLNVAHNYSEAYRFECEVKSVVRMYHKHGGDFVKKFILNVEKHRGSEAAARLREEALRLIKDRK